MTFEELNIFQKYVDNKIDYFKFRELTGSDNDMYLSEQWDKFRKNPIEYITSREERQMFEQIMKEIIRTDYKG